VVRYLLAVGADGEEVLGRARAVCRAYGTTPVRPAGRQGSSDAIVRETEAMTCGAWSLR
jgi:hypothetical protein